MAAGNLKRKRSISLRPGKIRYRWNASQIAKYKKSKCKLVMELPPPLVGFDFCILRFDLCAKDDLHVTGRLTPVNAAQKRGFLLIIRAHPRYPWSNWFYFETTDNTDGHG